MDAERWAISVVGQGVRGGVATGKMPSFERDQATCHVRITATARLSQRAAKDPERLHGNAAPMFYCGWSVMPLTVASECSQSQLVPREIGRKQGFLGCSFSLGEVPAAPASRCFYERPLALRAFHLTTSKRGRRARPGPARRRADRETHRASRFGL